MNNNDFDRKGYYSYDSQTPQSNNGAWNQNPNDNHINGDAGEGKARAAMILGIIALVLVATCCCFYISPILAIISIVMAVMAKNRSADHRFHGMALAGLICSIIALVLTVLLVLYVALVWQTVYSSPEFQEYLDEIQRVSNSYR